MNPEDPVDLSPLDPLQDPDHWREVVERTHARVDLLLANRQTDPLTLIAGWSRTLTLVAAIAILALIPVELLLEKREARLEQIELLSQLAVASVRGESAPTGAELSRVILVGGPP